MTFLQVIWFLLVGLLLTVYAVLDGFDLGVGFWHLFTRKDEERRNLIGAIGPVWDGNEVWLLTGGGALFAAFPPVYATVFSGFYLAFMLVLFALIFRAVAIEFRSMAPSPRWRGAWDLAFGLGSALPALLFGVVVGNLLRGVPLDADGAYAGTFLGLLNAYALLIGVVGFIMIITHGALYIALKTDGEQEAQARRRVDRLWIVYLAFFIAAFLMTIAKHPERLANYRSTPVLWLIPVLALVAIVLIAFFNRRGEIGRAFASSCSAVVCLMGTAGASLFPNLVPALDDPALSLTISNSSSSQLTLWTMLVITLVGMPLVTGYTIWTYRTFAGKVRPGEQGYEAH